MDINRSIQDFSKLGQIFNWVSEDQNFPDKLNHKLIDAMDLLRTEIKSAELFNPWFTEENVKRAMGSLGTILNEQNLTTWLSGYPDLLSNKTQHLNVGVVMAGNIPLVGFHDFLCVLISHHNLIAKLSSDDSRLLPAVSKVLTAINPEFADRIQFTNEKITGFDAIIATGSNNTSRYFEQYFGKYPHIIRKSRQSIAILTGNETESDFGYLGHDLFSYFGLGCRNVSSILIPPDFDPQNFFNALSSFHNIIDNYKYRNNYIYRKTIYELTNTPFLDTGYCLFVNQDFSTISSPIGVINIIKYSDFNQLNDYLSTHETNIQCIVGSDKSIKSLIPFGKSQYPDLWDYADNIDTLKFLIDLKKT